MTAFALTHAAPATTPEETRAFDVQLPLHQSYIRLLVLLHVAAALLSPKQMSTADIVNNLGNLHVDRGKLVEAFSLIIYDRH